MNPRKNLTLALVIAGMAYLAFHREDLPIKADWHWDHAPPTMDSLDPIAGQDPLDHLARAMRLQKSNETRFFSIPGVVGTGVGWTESGSPVIKVFVEYGATLPVLAQELGGFPLLVQRTGRFVALGQEAVDQEASPQEAPGEAGQTGTIAQERVRFSIHPKLSAASENSGGVLPNTRFDRPVPMGVSTGHTQSTAGTIGAVVTDGSKLYALSNWHVFVPAGKARIGDELLQPGPIDGGVQPTDVIGTLAAFEQVTLSPFASNRIDAAIARTDDVMPQTPSDGYGSPRSETMAAKPGLGVQKYGRTTGLTFGEVDAINASINVSYGSAGQVARFTGQIVLCCDMSQGGDSGSLIVAHDVDSNGNPGPNDRRPVALLFAGDRRLTIANPIDLVLDRFGVTIVGEEGAGR